MGERDKNSGVGCFILGMVGLLGLPLYVFSIGPVAWLVKGTTWEWICVIYFPLGALASFFPQVDKVLQWYLNLWLG